MIKQIKQLRFFSGAIKNIKKTVIFVKLATSISKITAYGYYLKRNHNGAKQSTNRLGDRKH